MIKPEEKRNEKGPVKIALKNVNMVFEMRKGTLEAIKDVDLEIYDGEFVCFIGPSGCGKSTLLRIIAGLLKPTSGEVLINGHLTNKPGADRAMVFQEDSVFPWLTVEQNIEYGLKVRKIKSEDRKKIVEHYLSMVGLQRKGIKQLLPKELSGGMRKRVDMARAFANDPEVLLMDEPFGMLDAMTKEHLQIETLNLWGETKKTICFVTHDLEEAIFLADRIIMMDADPGKIHSFIYPPFKHPRDASLKMTLEFQDMRREVLKTLNALSAKALCAKGGETVNE